VRVAPLPSSSPEKSTSAPAACRAPREVSREVGVGQALLGDRGQHRVGAELEEAGGALLLEMGDAVAEAHGLADLGGPVGGGGGLLG
jgi:hypothetical protein